MGKAKENAGDLIHRAQTALQQRHHQEARAFFFQALEIDPDHADAHYGLATVAFHQGDVLAAVYHFRAAIRREPGRAGAYVNLGALYNHLGRDDDALTILRKGIQLDPLRAEGFYNLGLVLRKLNRVDDAAAAYMEAVRIQPGLGEAHFNLANLYLDAESFPEAIAQYREALKARSNWPAARQGLAIAEAALREQDGVVALTPPPAVDATRLVDPVAHHQLLSHINHAVAASDALAKSLGSDVTQQLEAALKDLGQCFLRSDTPGYILVKRLEVFESAAARLKQTHQELEGLSQQVAKWGEDLKGI